MRGKVMLTGDRPTGNLHLGHYVGSIKSRLEAQNTGQLFIMVADMQALTDNSENPEKIKKSVREVVIDYLSCGIDPQKATIFIQSQIAEIAELALLFMNLVTLARLSRNPTVKSEMVERGYKSNVPIGFLVYPISQAADILSFKPDIVPVGEDQLPMIEQTNEIVDKFNRLYGDVFTRVKAVVPKNEDARLPGLDGKAKMSKSLNNCIYLKDSEDEVRKKVMKMYTDPNHIHKKDPGEVKGNVVFSYLRIFDSNQEEVKKLESDYIKGGLGDVEIKERLAGVLNNLLAPIRKKRKLLENDTKYIDKVLREGTKKAQKKVSETFEEVKKAMLINYSL